MAARRAAAHERHVVPDAEAEWLSSRQKYLVPTWQDLKV